MPTKKRKLGQGQPTLSEIFARQPIVNPSTPNISAATHESKRHFLINFDIVSNENEFGFYWTLCSKIDSNCISGTISCQNNSEYEVEIESAGTSTTTSRASTPQDVLANETSQDMNCEENESDNETIASNDSFG